MSSQSIDLKNKSALQQPPAEEKFKSVLELLEEDDEFEVLIIIYYRQAKIFHLKSFLLLGI